MSSHMVQSRFENNIKQHYSRVFMPSGVKAKNPVTAQALWADRRCVCVGWLASLARIVRTTLQYLPLGSG